MVQLDIKRRAQHALRRQLDYQRQKASRIAGHEEELMASMAVHSRDVQLQLERIRPLPENAKVLEVGSGAPGLIFFFDAPQRVGVDPLADDYRRLFPLWQTRATTIAAFGERLPFEAGQFDVLLCDNVVDHAESPRKIV